MRYEDDPDKQPLKFGKYKGQTPEAIADIDPSYLVWMWDNVDNPPMTEEMFKTASLACEFNTEYANDRHDLTFPE